MERSSHAPSPLHVVESGAGEEAFVLLHGFGGSSYTWRHWVPRLELRGRVLAVDLKGFGRSAKPDDDDYGPHTQAELVAALIQERDLRHVTLVGHSLGGGVALLTALALQGTERVRRMVLVGSTAYRQRLPPLVPLSRRPRLSRLLIRLLGPRRIMRWTLRSIVHDPGSVDERQVAEYARALETPEGLTATMAAGRSVLPEDLDDFVARYPSLTAPTLLVWGAHDRVIPLWVGRRLADELPDARIRVLERCGHLPQEERPEASWSVVAEFLEAVP